MAAPEPTPLRPDDDEDRPHSPLITETERRRLVEQVLSDGRVICRECGTTWGAFGQLCAAPTGRTCQGVATIQELLDLQPVALERRAQHTLKALSTRKSAVDEATNVVRLPRARNDAFDAQDLASWQGLEPQPVSWLVEGLIPRQTTVLLSGQTTLGKSYLMQHLLSCCALGKPWLGYTTEATRVLGLFCEEPRDRLLWRQAQINRALETDYDDYHQLAYLQSRWGRDNWLFSADRRTEVVSPTGLWVRMVDWLLANGIQLVLIDTVRQTFDLNENSGHQVTAALNLCNQIAEAIDGAVILTHHPPKAGDSEFAGSAAWANTCRAHLHLRRPDAFSWSNGEGRGDRLLRPMSANWSGDQPDLALKWDTDAQMFVLRNNQTSASPGSQFDQLQLDQDVLRAIDLFIADNTWLQADSGSRHSLPARLKGLAGFRHYSVDALFASQERLLGKGKLVRVTIGRGASAAVLLRPPALKYANEAI